MSRPNYRPIHTLSIADSPLPDSSLLHFWEWAFGDLCDDDIKGIFAEWMILKLLGIASTRRISWANCDIVTPERVRIEVKTSSRWQSWKLLDGAGKPYDPPLYPATEDAKIRFSGLMARDATTIADSSATPEFKSDIYVFAFQKEWAPERWNAVDLLQWEFYVLPAKRIKEIGLNSISLKRLRAEQNPMTAAEFVAKARILIEEAALETRAQSK